METNRKAGNACSLGARVMFYRIQKRKAGLTAFSAKQGFTHAMYVWTIMPPSGGDHGGETQSFLILTCTNGKEIWRVMSAQVGREAYSRVVRCHLLHRTRHCRFVMMCFSRFSKPGHKFP